MAVINLESLVLRARAIAGHFVTGTTRLDSNTANSLTPASMSQGRYPASHFPRTGFQSRSRRYGIDVAVDVDSAGIRAGRSGSFAGVLVSRSPAQVAGLALAGREPSATAVWGRGLCQAQPAAPVGKVLPPRSHTPLFRAERQEALEACWRSKPAGKRGEVDAAWFMPPGGTRPASTRGKGGR